MKRARVVGFLIQTTTEINVTPIVKYTSLSLFADRFVPSLPRFLEQNKNEHWLLQPVRESNLQLFALISILVSSKICDSHPFTVHSLKSFGDKSISEQHFTTRDYADAELVFLQMLNYEIGTMGIAFVFLEQLYAHFKEVAKVGELVNFDACMDLMDLLYENEEISILYNSPRPLAAALLVATYVITVPKKIWEFPVLPWVKQVTSCKEEDIVCTVNDILNHVFNPSNEDAM